MSLSLDPRFDIRLQTGETVAHRPNPYASHRSFKMFKISPSAKFPHLSPSYVSITTIHITLPVRPCHGEPVLTILGVVRQGEIRYGSVAH